MKNIKKLLLIASVLVFLFTVTGCAEEEVNPLLGTWETSDIIIEGVSVLESFGDPAKVTLVLNEEGRGTLAIAEQLSEIKWIESESTISITDTTDMTIEFSKSAENMLSFKMYGVEYTLTKLVEKEVENE